MYMKDYVATQTSSGRPGGWFFHYLANPARFQRVVRPALPWLSGFALVVTAAGLVWGYGFAPPDWQQGYASRIMYVHVPAAWVAMAGYVALAGCSFVSLVWRHPLADIAAEEIGPVGAGFTFLCLVTGSLWGKPMWGTYWVWDARLTSVLILLFLYLGHITLIRAFDNKTHAYRAASILALAGAINLPIIIFSVQWWNTLHQGNTISFAGNSGIYITMLYPLIISTLGFYMTFAVVVLARMSAALCERKTTALLRAATERDL